MSISGVLRAYYDHVIAVQTKEELREDEYEITDALLEAASTGDYSAIAKDFAGAFWEASSVIGFDAAQDVFQPLFAELIAKFPKLGEALRKELREQSPVDNLVAWLVPEPKAVVAGGE